MGAIAAKLGRRGGECGGSVANDGLDLDAYAMRLAEAEGA